MTDTHATAQDYEARLRALVDGRMAAGSELAKAAQERAEKRAALDEAESGYAARYSAAIDAGWTSDELRKIGLDSNGHRAPKATRKRPGRAAGSSPVTSAASSSAADAPSTPTE